MTTKTQIFVYIFLLLVVSWTIQILAILVTGSINSDSARIWLLVTMMSPFIVTIFFLSTHKNLKQHLLWKPNSKIFVTSFLAVLIPVIIAFAVLLTIKMLNYGQSEWFSFTAAGVNIAGGPFLIAQGHQSWPLFILNIVVTGAAFALLNAVVATGEEFAWRGLLQPLLTKQFGLFRGVTLLGLVWSVWHLPALLNGYNYPDNPLIGSFIFFPMRLIATSYFYFWLSQKSKSFIPASIAHGALNGIQTGIVSNIKMNTGQIAENIITIAVTVLIGLIFLWVMMNEKKTKQE